MSGVYETWQQDAPGGYSDTSQMVASQTASSESTAASRQSDAARFIAENGHAVMGGHSAVGSPRNG